MGDFHPNGGSLLSPERSKVLGSPFRVTLSLSNREPLNPGIILKASKNTL
jgi:hypothetical protein